MWPEGFCITALSFYFVFSGLFSQEGWRLENENPSDPNSPLVFKGVVFNEMKGAFVSHRFLMQLRHIFSFLFKFLRH